MDEIMLGLAKLAPVVAVLVAGIYYFFTKEKGYKAEIKELNDVIRTQERKTLEIMSKLTSTLDKIANNDVTNKESILAELKSLKEILIARIDSIK